MNFNKRKNKTQDSVISFIRGIGKALDSNLSLIVRENSNTCVSCGKHTHETKKQAGHFVDRGCKSLRWNLNNVKMQCIYCNNFRNSADMVMSYEDELIKRGVDTVKLKQERFKTYKLEKHICLHLLFILIQLCREVDVKCMGTSFIKDLEVKPLYLSEAYYLLTGSHDVPKDYITVLSKML